MKRISTLFYFVVFTICCVGQVNSNKLRFRNNGEFRILQFTDCHYKYGKSASEDCITLIETMTMIEDVDLIVFTGDNVYADNEQKALNELFFLKSY